MIALMLRGALTLPLIVLGSMTATPSDAPPASVATVAIANYAFTPAELTVKAGDTVTFVNRSGETHTASATDGTFESGRLEPNDSFAFTFSKAGTYAYRCRVHTSMRGTIVVVPATDGEPR
jgi:plastocyanin